MPHPAAAVWEVVGDAGRIDEWFPGIVACEVATADDGTVVRTVTLGTGLRLEEHVVTDDPLLRRFQYRIAGGIFREHLGTVDVIELDPDESLVVYSTDAEPAVMALVIGGASGQALANLSELVTTAPAAH